MPKVSVIMPTYNCEHSIGEAIESVLLQTFSDFELIICDDQSTDRTVEIIKRYRYKDHRVVLLRNKKNAGCGMTLNRCILAAQGEYFVRMDSDDISLPERFLEQVAFLDAYPEYVMVGTYVDIFNRDGVYSTFTVPECPDKKLFRNHAPFVHATLMIRREVFNSVGLYKGRDQVFRSEDYDLLARIYAAGFKGYNITKVLYLYRVENEDYKKRKFINRIAFAHLKLNVFKLLNFKWYEYIYILKPVIGGLVPPYMHRWRLSRRFKVRYR